MLSNRVLDGTVDFGLPQVGAFGAPGLNRRELSGRWGCWPGDSRRPSCGGARDRQLRMPLPTEQDAVALADFNAAERMGADYALLRLSTDSHPMQFLRGQLGEGVVSSRHPVRDAGRRSRVDLAGLVVCRQQPLTARGDRVPAAGG
jgi:DNA polymerase III alpha subunit